MDVRALLTDDVLKVWWDVPTAFQLTGTTAAYDANIGSSVLNVTGADDSTFRKSRGLWPRGCSAVNYDYSNGTISFDVNDI